MEIEQRPPEKPNFLLILILACAALLVLFIIAYIFARSDANHLGFRHHRANPTSQLALPAPADTSSLA